MLGFTRHSVNLKWEKILHAVDHNNEPASFQGFPQSKTGRQSLLTIPGTETGLHVGIHDSRMSHELCHNTSLTTCDKAVEAHDAVHDIYNQLISYT